MARRASFVAYLNRFGPIIALRYESSIRNARVTRLVGLLQVQLEPFGKDGAALAQLAHTVLVS